MANLNTDLLSPEQAIEATVAAYNSKAAIQKIEGLEASASEIDGVIDSLKVLTSITPDSFANEYVTYATGARGSNTGWITNNYTDINENNIYYATAAITGDITALAIYFDVNNSYLGYEYRGTAADVVVVSDYELTLPLGTKNISITSRVGSVPTPILKTNAVKSDIGNDISILSNSLYWKNKSIVWFGTSIPTGSTTNNYPKIVGESLGCTVYNESVAASMARNGLKTLVVIGTDPYGWGTMGWQGPAYALSATISEKQYLIDNWDYWKTKLTGTPPTTLSDTEKAKILDCSYENRLYRHLGDGQRKDLYVFDHGHNDNWGSEMKTVPTDTYDRGTFIGAVNFLIKEILTDNPKACICFIGHYENDRKTDISLAQTILAEIHDFPLLPLWSKLGWTQRTVLVGGVSKTFTQIWMPDNLHPHSDTTRGANQKIASHIVPFIQNEVR